jgi:hypothetical protein
MALPFKEDDSLLGPAAEPEHDNAELLRAVRRFNSRVLGMTCGLVFGLVLFLATIILVIKGGDQVGAHLGLLSQYFPGYDVTWGGAFVGLLYGFVTGYWAGWLLGWVYNTVATVRFERLRREVGAVRGRRPVNGKTHSTQLVHLSRRRGAAHRPVDKKQ